MEKEEKKVDAETAEIQRKIKQVGDMVDHEAWSIVEAALLASIQESQNLADLKLSNYSPGNLMIELRAREVAVTIIGGWLSDIHGTAELSKIPVTDEESSYIIREEE